MEDSTLLKIALGTSLIGIFLLYFAALNFSPKDVLIKEIDEELLGTVVKTSGIVVEFKEFEKSVVISIKDESVIKVFAFKSIVPSDLKQGKALTVVGEVKEYKGELEIVPLKEGDIVLQDGG